MHVQRLSSVLLLILLTFVFAYAPLGRWLVPWGATRGLTQAITLIVLCVHDYVHKTKHCQQNKQVTRQQLLIVYMPYFTNVLNRIERKIEDGANYFASTGTLIDETILKYVLCNTHAAIQREVYS